MGEMERKLARLAEERVPKAIPENRSEGEIFKGEKGPNGGTLYTYPRTGETGEWFYIVDESVTSPWRRCVTVDLDRQQARMERHRQAEETLAAKGQSASFKEVLAARELEDIILTHGSGAIPRQDLRPATVAEIESDLKIR